MVGGGCGGGNIDAGRDAPGPLPVDRRNPVILANDSATDNWAGEYAVLLASTGGPPLAGIIVNASTYWPDLAANVNGWTQLVAAARESGLTNLPDPTPSAGAPLERPADGLIEHTKPRSTEGAQLIVELSARLALPSRPVVVVTGSRLTDVANAYLLDPTVADRVVVVSALGTSSSAGGGVMGWPNGELDTWAGWIVGQRFRYVQVNGYYEQKGDVSTAKATNLPDNPFGAWMAAKIPSLLTIAMSSDQVGILAVGVPTFVTSVGRAAIDATAEFDGTTAPPLVMQPGGAVWLAPDCDGALAGEKLWQMLSDPRTFAP